MNTEQLCVFTRYPKAGTTKTRLIPALGADAAAGIQYAMTAHALDVASQIGHTRGSAVQVRFEGGNPTRMREAFGTEFEYLPQGHGDLGDRMQRCLREALDSGAESVIILGSDVPGIDAELLTSAFEALKEHPLVIGPATDGGYYLIGLRQDAPELFQDMPWGTDDVLRRTLTVAGRNGIAVHQLPALSDVDRPEDLDVLAQAWGEERLTEALGRVSVIIPTLNEAHNIEALLESLRLLEPTVEIIVVDGGSTDGTVDAAERAGAKLLVTRPGRAGQMNAGAAAATGGILLFLHADTRLVPDYSAFVRHTLRRHGVVAGAFRFKLDASGSGYRLLEKLANWRSRVLQMPYGDQALFITARIFRSLGGFPDMPIMEDFEMARRLKRRGRIALAPRPATTSARRWRERGPLKTTLLNQLMIAGYLLGIPHDKLARMYRGQ